MAVRLCPRVSRLCLWGSCPGCKFRWGLPLEIYRLGMRIRDPDIVVDSPARITEDTERFSDHLCCVEEHTPLWLTATELLLGFLHNSQRDLVNVTLCCTMLPGFRYWIPQAGLVKALPKNNLAHEFKFLKTGQLRCLDVCPAFFVFEPLRGYCILDLPCINGELGAMGVCGIALMLAWKRTQQSRAGHL